MAHLPNPDDDPISVEDLIVQRINRDPHTLQHFTAASDVIKILADLERDGYVKGLKAGWKNTQDGFDLLTGPPDETAATPTTAAIGLDPATLGGKG
jgi:hypothetical protein